MIQGSGSHVGKSVITAALCRIFKNKGYRVAPFKAQNMSNNSFATPEGGEIGRAQAAQAEASGVEPSVLMNPVLLKPLSDKEAQIIVMGKPIRDVIFMGDSGYHTRFMPVVGEALQKLREIYDVVVIEGAGSPAEMNLMSMDIVNMSIARLVKSPVLLVGNIDWGGIFAQLVGTYELLEPEEKKLVRGFIINKFRGEIKLLKPGLHWIEQKTGKKVLGVLPFIHDLAVAEEDSIVMDHAKKEMNVQKLLVQVIRFPHISNFTDFDALRHEPDVDLQYIHEPNRHELPDLLILPGTKSTMSDLEYLWQSGLAHHIQRCARASVSIVGICGGYQMLGHEIFDSEGIESKQNHSRGLGLLPVVTKFKSEKTTKQVKAIHAESQLSVEGYEIHMGETQSIKGASPLFKIVQRGGDKVDSLDGFCKDGILGTYIHGMFDQSGFRRYFLNQIRERAGLKPLSVNTSGLPQNTNQAYDQLAEMMQNHADISFIETLLEG